MIRNIEAVHLCSTGTHVGAETIDWKDIDGIGAPCFHTPCTPPGCIEILDRSGVELNGTNAVVVVRSNLVGLPVAMLLMHRDPINTVNIVHSKTTDAPTVVGRADVVCGRGSCGESNASRRVRLLLMWGLIGLWGGGSRLRPCQVVLDP